MIEKEWDEDSCSWEGAILKLREFIGKRRDNIFRKPKEPNDIPENVRQQLLLEIISNFFLVAKF